MTNLTPPPPPTPPTEDRPALGDLNELGLLREQLKATWRVYDLLRQLQSPGPDPASATALSIGTQLDQAAGAPTTPSTPSPATEFKLPETLKSVQGDEQFEVLANGYTVPRALIEVLNDFEKLAPGATVREARPAIVAQILVAHDSVKTGAYPFCLDDAAHIPEKGSPCILRKGHRGRHKDNDDGSWA